MQVLVTRPQGEAGKWVDALRTFGFDAVALPLIAVAGPPAPERVVQAWGGLSDYDALMFVSANAVDQFFAARPDGCQFPASDGAAPVRAWATGPGTQSALRRAGVNALWVDGPDPGGVQFDSEALWVVVKDQVTAGFKVLIVRGADGPQAGDGDGRNWLAEQVRAAGGCVDYVVAYQRLLPVWGDAQTALAAQAAGDGAVWLFSSSQAIRNLALLCPRQPWTQARAVVTHERIAQTAQALGFGQVVQSRPSVAGLAASIESLQ